MEPGPPVDGGRGSGDRGFVRPGKTSVYILSYHSFLGTGTSSMDFSEAELLDHLEKFRKLRYRWVSMEEAISGSLQGRKNLVFTLDDMHRTAADAYLRIPRPAGIVPTPSVSAAQIKYDKLYLKPERLKKLRDLGCLVGAHGYSLYYLTKGAFESEPRRSLLLRSL